MLTLFHNQKFCEQVSQLEIDESLKQTLRETAGEFMSTLFRIAEFNPEQCQAE
jgi:hypothetical protein